MRQQMADWAELVEELRAATSCLSDDAPLRSIAFERLLKTEIEARQAAREVAEESLEPAPSNRRLNPWSMEEWTPEERVADLAQRWSIEPRQVRGVVDPTNDEPRLCLAAAALALNEDDAIRQIALLLTSARVDSLYNTDVGQVRAAAKEYGLEQERVECVLEAMHERTILLVDLQHAGPRDVYLLPDGHSEARAIAQELTANGR